jgi:hypothetical protein
MATSFLTYNKRGFWLRDEIFCITNKQIATTIKNNCCKEQWLIEMAKELDESSRGYFIGFTSMYLDDYLDSEQNTKHFIVVLLQTIDRLSPIEFISVEELNNEPNSGIKFTKDISSIKIIKILEHIILLLENKLNWTEKDTTGWEFEED